jgi:hypothetical protein
MEICMRMQAYMVTDSPHAKKQIKARRMFILNARKLNKPQRMHATWPEETHARKSFAFWHPSDGERAICGHVIFFHEQQTTKRQRGSI